MAYFLGTIVKNYKKGEVIKHYILLGASNLILGIIVMEIKLFILQGNYVLNPKLIYGVNVNYSSWQDDNISIGIHI